MSAEIPTDAKQWAHHAIPGISPDLLRIAEAEKDAIEILSWGPNSIDPLLWMPDFYTSYPNYQGTTARREDNFAFEKARAHAVIASSREGHPRVMRFMTSLAALRQAHMAGTGHSAHIASISELPTVSIQVFEDLGRVWPSQIRSNFRVIRGEHGALAVAEHALGVEITDDPEAIKI